MYRIIKPKSNQPISMVVQRQTTPTEYYSSSNVFVVKRNAFTSKFTYN